MSDRVNAQGGLPPGWRSARLGDVCVQDRQIVPPGSPFSRTLPYLGLEHIESHTGRLLLSATSDAQSAGVSSTFAFSERHVLYGKLRPYLNKVALPDFRGRCSTEIIPLLPATGVTREFLALLLRRPSIAVAAMQEKTGSRMPRADMRVVLRQVVPIPPLPEQRRIAAILDEQMAAVERARAAAQAQLAAINALPAALLRRAFSGEL